MLTSDFDYNLPAELIAQEPLAERDLARMMVLPRISGEPRHSCVRELPDFLQSGDLLVVNDTRVVPARLFGCRQDTGGAVEVLLVEDYGRGEWDAFLRCSGKHRAGIRMNLADGRLVCEVVGPGGPGRVRIRFPPDADVKGVMEDSGVPPLPPYIRRSGRGRDEQARRDADTYQTMFAREAGAVAAPTAGLHFTSPLVASLASHGVKVLAVTLHVGPGTFKPVTTDSVEGHAMESERYVVRGETADAIRETRLAGGRVVAVGTTVVRTLETVASENGGIVVASSGRSSIFIHEPWTFRAVDGVLTNFHLPRSTLLMLVSAFAGRERIMNAYAEAVRGCYRFYSYGDCMLIL